MIRTLTYTVTEEEAGVSLLEWLRDKGCSRQVLAHLKNTKGLFKMENVLLQRSRCDQVTR